MAPATRLSPIPIQIVDAFRAVAPAIEAFALEHDLLIDRYRRGKPSWELRFARRVGKHILPLNEQQLRLLRDYDWPGNVRHLRNLVESMVVQDQDEILNFDDLEEAAAGFISAWTTSTPASRTTRSSSNSPLRAAQCGKRTSPSCSED